MTKQVFLDKLRETLAGEVNADVIYENLRFYEEYFMTEERKGRSEADILSELGDPRLIARTIIDTSAANEGAYRRTSYAEETENFDDAKETKRVYQMPGWMVLLIILAVIILGFVILGSVVSFLMPVLIPLCIVLFIVQLIRRN